ncbi:MAG TPA: ABC transporter [Clostridiales bacterium]|nr:ABC transporter [Clostridiales bacterium]
MGKEKLDVKGLKKVFKYVKPYTFSLIIATLFAIAGSVAIIMGPEKISNLVSTIQKGIFGTMDIDGIVGIGIALICIYLSGAVLSYLQQFIMATITQKTAKKLRSDIDEKINKIPLKFFDTTTKGDILSTVTNDIDTISQTLASSIANLLSAITLFAGTIFMMFKTNWILALVTIGTSVIGFVFLALILKKSQKYFNKKQVDLAVMNGQIEEVFSNHKVVSIFAGKKNETEKFEKINLELYNDNWKSQSLAMVMRNVMSFIGNLTYVLVFIVGVYFIVNGDDAITLGTITSFIIYSRLFTQPLTTFAQSMSSLQQASAASKRVFVLLDQPELENEEDKIATFDKIEGNIVFDNIKFGYTKDKEIIHGFSANIKSGQKVAIVGPTGSGKTTIVNLLMRFYEINSGDIKIDNVSIKDMKRETVHGLFDMILQDTWLFEGTIRENLVYNKTDVKDEELQKVCEAVGLSHFISTLPNGYDSLLSDAVSISEGQKQQLTIARAMIKNSPLLILDEATSNVDTRTELIIQSAMDKLTKGRTSFIIAHRLSTIKNADLILVLKDGDIIESGTHNSLLLKNGFYAELYNSQFNKI